MVVTRRRSAISESMPLKDIQLPHNRAAINKKAKTTSGIKREVDICESSENVDDTSLTKKKTNENSFKETESAFENQFKKLKVIKFNKRQPRRSCVSKDANISVEEESFEIASCSAQDVEECTLVGRDKEFSHLLSGLKANIESGTSLSLYISGPPGSGKTATVMEVLKSLKKREKFISVYVNCVSYSNEKDVMREIYSKIPNSKRNVLVSRLQMEIENVFVNTPTPILLILDEIDGVKTKGNFFHYCVFQWPAKFPMVSLIGIANSLDLTVRILPKLKLQRPPQMLTFSPYSRDTLIKIVHEKLALEDFDVQTAELCSRKVAAMTGDVRTAVNIARQMFSRIRNENSQSDCSAANVLAVAANTLSEICTPTAKKARLPLQQKIILATILRLSEILNSSLIKKEVLQSSYDKICSHLSLPSLDRDSAHFALNLLEAQELIRCGRESYRLLIDSQSVRSIIGDVSLTSRVAKISSSDLLGM